MRSCIKKYTENKEFYIEEGCYITELSNSTSDPGLSIARARVEVGVTTHMHKLLNTIERYVILEGEGLVEVGEDAAKKITANDVVLIPAECAQRITNIGSNDLIFLVLCTPRFINACYQAMHTSKTI